MKSSSLKGINVSVGFFENIIIPRYLMKPGTEYDATTQEWAWKYEDEDTIQDLCIKDGDSIHFRVHTIKFTKTSRSGKVYRPICFYFIKWQSDIMIKSFALILFQFCHFYN